MKQYLEKLPREIQRIIASCSDVARENNVNAYLVGGFVRDLILGVNNFDLDEVIEGDGISFARALSHRMNAHLIRHPRFGTATLVLGHNSKIDIASSRVECYPEPACLPSVRSGCLKDDLRRRDFTINAMAISINRHDYAKLIDYFDGIDDLKNKKIRVLHDLSFIDDPTRILRGIRFEQRYNFRIEPHTLGLLKKSVSLRMIRRVQPQRLRDELILILKEELPIKSLKRIQELVTFSFIDKNLALGSGSYRLLKSVEKQIKWFKNFYGNRRHLDSWLLYFMAITHGLSSSGIESVLKRLVLRKGDEKRIASFRKINASFIRRLNKKDVLASEVYKLLDPLSYEVILLIKAKYKNKYLQRNIEDFLRVYNLVRLHINGHDLRKVGLKPGPHYQKILAKVFAAKLDSEVATKEEELALMQKLSSK